MPVLPDTDDNIVYLTAPQVCQRFGGISDMTLYRWVKAPDLGFPKPIYFSRLRFWKLAELEAWEARQPGAHASEPKAA